MAAEVLFHRLAAREYRSARDWYEHRSPQAAEQFRQAVDRAVDRISTDPEALPVILARFRYVRVNRFPYVLIFRRVDSRFVMVVAVAHTSRRPGYWRRRS